MKDEPCKGSAAPTEGKRPRPDWTGPVIRVLVRVGIWGLLAFIHHTLYKTVGEHNIFFNILFVALMFYTFYLIFRVAAFVLFSFKTILEQRETIILIHKIENEEKTPFGWFLIFFVSFFAPFFLIGFIRAVQKIRREKLRLYSNALKLLLIGILDLLLTGLLTLLFQKLSFKDERFLFLFWGYIGISCLQGLAFLIIGIIGAVRGLDMLHCLQTLRDMGPCRISELSEVKHWKKSKTIAVLRRMIRRGFLPEGTEINSDEDAIRFPHSQDAGSSQTEDENRESEASE